MTPAKATPGHRSSRSICQEAGRLVLLIVVLGVGSWLLRPDRIDLRADPEVYALDLPVPLVSLDDALAAYDEGLVMFIDTRADATLETAVPGAFIIRAATFAEDLDAVRDFIFPEDPLILYGADGPLPVSDVATRLLNRGQADLRILQGGLAAWRRAGGPIEGEVAP